ncbi:hypothetical protein JCM24511_08703 [Saitozyma sp. JCM 24511]|nr:hypothetical protein JCM24511_08703 [Saitozyma sp. JCM 24511]
MQYDKDINKQNDQLEAEGYEVLPNDKDGREDTAETMASATSAAPDAIAEGLANVRIESREQTAQPDEAAHNDESSSDSELEWVQITVPVYKHRRHGGRSGRHHRGPPGFGPMGLGPMPPFHPWAHHGMSGFHGKRGHGKGSRHHRAHSPSGSKSGGGRRGKGCRGGRHSDKNDKDDFQVRAKCPSLLHPLGTTGTATDTGDLLLLAPSHSTSTACPSPSLRTLGGTAWVVGEVDSADSADVLITALMVITTGTTTVPSFPAACLRSVLGTLVPMDRTPRNSPSSSVTLTQASVDAVVIITATASWGPSVTVAGHPLFLKTRSPSER